MYRFIEFMREIRWAWIACIATTAVTVVMGLAGYFYEHRAVEKRIELLQEFYLDRAAPNSSFIAAVRTLFGGTAAPKERLEALNVFQSAPFEEKRSIFSGLRAAVVQTLMTDRDGIQPIIREERRRADELAINWFPGTHRDWVWGFHPAVLVWQVVSVISILIYWGWKYSYAMSYFPYRRWWFWIFIAITFPWSSLVGAVFAMSFIANGISKIIARRRRKRAASASYDDFCADLNRKLPELREKWEALFPARIRRVKIGELEERTRSLRARLEGMGTELQAVQREYAESRAALERMTCDSARDAERDEALWRREWQDELERLAAHPKVRGLQISGSRKLEIYTDTFATLWGMLGPMLVKIDLETYEVSAGIAHETAVMGSLGEGDPDHFCFGTVWNTIRNLVASHKINDAFGVMVASFEASAHS